MIRKAIAEDICAVAQIYDEIHTEEEAGRASVGWVRNVYPTEETAKEALAKGDLYVLADEGKIVAAARINQEQVPEYELADWEFEAADAKIMVLHTLVVSPSAGSRGYGKQFVEFYEQLARERNCPYLRMDTNERNQKARGFYRKMGYKEVDIVPCVFNGIEGVRLVCLEKKLEMRMDRIRVRTATVQDAENLLKIYAPYVERTAITFEYDVPTTEEFAERISRTLKKYPYLVAEINGEIAGYSYAGAFKGRPAYDWAVETTIYVDMDRKKTGIGRKLYESLELALRAQNILNLNACIAYPVKEDEYLTRDSVEFHEHLGYRMVGEFRECGYKFNRWYNMVWMEKHIGQHMVNQPQVIPFKDICKTIVFNR